jgi:hypothetical protein
MAKKHFKAIASSIRSGKLSRARANVLKLLEACPFHVTNPEDCPLFEVRNLEPAMRLQWVEALSESDLKYLASYHRVCIKIKTESGSARKRSRARAGNGRKREVGH